MPTKKEIPLCTKPLGEVILILLRFLSKKLFLFSIPQIPLTLCFIGAKVNVSNKTSNTPLHFATQRGYMECVKELVTLGANLNATNDKGFTPFHNAIMQAKDELLKNSSLVCFQWVFYCSLIFILVDFQHF